MHETSVSLPPPEEPQNSFAERRPSRRHSSMHETSVSLPPPEEPQNSFAERRPSRRHSSMHETSVSLPPREEPRNSFAERRPSRRHSSMHEAEIVPVETETVPFEASVEEDVATQQAADIIDSCHRKLSGGRTDPELQLDSTNTDDDYNAEEETEQQPQVGSGQYSPTKRRPSVRSQQDAGAR